MQSSIKDEYNDYVIFAWLITKQAPFLKSIEYDLWAVASLRPDQCLNTDTFGYWHNAILIQF